MRMKLYACGGAGINTVKQFAPFNGQANPGFATIETVFIDTSRSNLDSSIPEQMTYLVQELDGSGKRRATNHAALSESINEILLEHRPGDINIIVHSAGGGSGSVIGPLLTNELLGREQLVIVLAIGSTSSKIETENTKKTLQSLESISQRRSMPVCVYYRENTLEKPRGDIDRDVSTAISLMTAIFSGQNREFDTEDLRNFLNYPRVTSYPAKLSYLDLFAKDIDLDTKNEAIVSLITLSNGEVPTEVPQHVEYQATGYLHEAAFKVVKQSMPIHTAVIAGHFSKLIGRLDKRLAEFAEIRSTVHEKSILGSASTTDDGMVL